MWARQSRIRSPKITNLATSAFSNQTGIGKRGMIRGTNSTRGSKLLEIVPGTQAGPRLKSKDEAIDPESINYGYWLERFVLDKRDALLHHPSETQKVKLRKITNDNFGPLNLSGYDVDARTYMQMSARRHRSTRSSGATTPLNWRSKARLKQNSSKNSLENSYLVTPVKNPTVILTPMRHSKESIIIEGNKEDSVDLDNTITPNPLDFARPNPKHSELRNSDRNFRPDDSIEPTPKTTAPNINKLISFGNNSSAHEFYPRTPEKDICLESPTNHSLSKISSSRLGPETNSRLKPYHSNFLSPNNP